MGKSKSNKMLTNVLIGVAVFLSFVLLCMMCKDSELFSNLKEKVGYPRPQGNLPNFKYGTKPEFRQKERNQWADVLKKSGLMEKFKVKLPQSKTLLSSSMNKNKK